MEVKYEQISHLVLSETYDPPTYKVQFKDKNQDAPVDAYANVDVDNKTFLKNTGKQAVKTGVFYGAIRFVSNLFGNAVGGGIGGSVARSATYSAGSVVASKNTNTADVAKVKMTDELKKKKVVEAFNSILNFYEFDEAANTWKYKKV